MIVRSVGHSFVGLKTIGVLCIVYGDYAILHDDLVTRKANDALYELFAAIGVAVIAETRFAKYDNIAAIWDVLALGYACPCAR